MTSGAPTTSGPPRAGTPWDSPRRPRRGQPFLVTLGVLFLLPALVAAFLRLVPPTDDATAVFASFIPYGLVGNVLALIFLGVALIRARRRLALGLLTLVVAGLTALQLSWLLPFYISDNRPVTTPTFTVLSLNMLKGQANSEQVFDQAQQADVVVLLETTDSALRALKPLGWDERFPYAVGGLTGNRSDSAIYSRYPLSNGALIGHSSFSQWSATLQVPGIPAIHLVAAHPCNPYCGGNQFTSEHDQLRRSLQPYLAGPVIVAGDLNAVDDHGAMQNLKADGLESGADIAGAGFLPTYPANQFLPPLLPIDHVLVSQRLTVTEIHAFTVAGTDHRGLLATIGGTA